MTPQQSNGFSIFWLVHCCPRFAEIGFGRLVRATLASRTAFFAFAFLALPILFAQVSNTMPNRGDERITG
jgi:hypothetical protein